MKQAAKYATKSALTAVGMSATLAKYGLKATDSMFGGALKMANEFAPNSLGTPIKDLSKEIFQDALKWVAKKAADMKKNIH